MIDVRFTAEKSEYIEAQQLFLRESRRKGRRWRWPVAAIIPLSFVLVLITGPHPVQWGSLGAAWIFLLLPILIFFPVPLQKLTLGKRFQKERMNLTNMHVRVDSEGYWCDIPGQGSGVTYWAAYEKFFEGKTVFMWKAAYTFRLLPKRVLTPAEIDEVRAVASRLFPRNSFQ